MTTRGIYILPSLFTGANLASGFLSILAAIDGRFDTAAWLIILALAFDVLDGRVARWTGATSSFGVEFDSLADLISFGMAPAVMMYQMILAGMGRPGVAIALLYVLAGSLRLARFNVKAQDDKPASEFIGLPIPAAAGMLASFVLCYELFELGPVLNARTIPLIMQRMPLLYKAVPLSMVIISFLMVSTVPYVAVKQFKFSRPKPMQTIMLIIIGLLLILTYPQNTIFIIFLLYVLSGIVEIVLRFVRARRNISVLRLRRRSDDAAASAASPRE